MPYIVRKNGEKWCVYREGENGESTGDTFGCHDSEEQAEAQLRALYASEPEAAKAVRKRKEAQGCRAGERSSKWFPHSRWWADCSPPLAGTVIF